MDLKTIEWIINGLKKEVESLQQEIKEIKDVVANNNLGTFEVKTPTPEPSNDLLEVKAVLQILGMSYNTLQSIIRNGKIKPLRLSPRKIRFTRSSINEYLNSL